MLRTLWNDENGFVISAELVLVLTIGVLAMIVGLHAVSKAVTYELGDIASAIGAVEQSYTFDGFTNDEHAAWAGSAYEDEADECDCSEIMETKPKAKKDGSSTNQPENN